MALHLDLEIVGGRRPRRVRVDIADVIRDNRPLQQFADRVAKQLVADDPGLGSAAAGERAQLMTERLVHAALADHQAHLARKGQAVLKLSQVTREINDLLIDGFDRRKPIDLAAIERKLGEQDLIFRELGLPPEHPTLAEEAKKVGAELGVRPRRRRRPGEPLPAAEVSTELRVRLETEGELTRKGQPTGITFVLESDQGLWVRKNANAAFRVVEEEGTGRQLLQACTIENGVVTPSLTEYEVIVSHRGKPPATEVIQSHHFTQNELMRHFFGDQAETNYGYRGGSWPTIGLRNSKENSPHRLITDRQVERQEARKNLSDKPKGKGIYEWIRELMIEDARSVPEAQRIPESRIAEVLRASDDAFRRDILPNIPPEDRDELVGKNLFK